jgi:hypothetical protein
MPRTKEYRTLHESKYSGRDCISDMQVLLVLEDWDSLRETFLYLNLKHSFLFSPSVCCAVYSALELRYFISIGWTGL